MFIYYRNQSSWAKECQLFKKKFRVEDIFDNIPNMYLCNMYLLDLLESKQKFISIIERRSICEGLE